MKKEDDQAPNPGSRSDKMRAYRRAYWDRFKETRRRIYGTLTTEEYERIEARAKEAGRAVWAQVHAEAEAYVRGEYLPSTDLEESIGKLITQLRRIGNNLNQIARELHRKENAEVPDFMTHFAELEFELLTFLKRPWGELPQSDKTNDEK